MIFINVFVFNLLFLNDNQFYFEYCHELNYMFDIFFANINLIRLSKKFQMIFENCHSNSFQTMTYL